MYFYGLAEGPGGNYDYDCDGRPDIADTHPGAPEDWAKMAGRAPNFICPLGTNPTDINVKNPTNVATGNKYEEVLDLSVSTSGIPLEFRRSYNNQVSDDGPLGYGWTHTYDLLLR